MQTKQVAWSLDDKPTVLLLPALSSISTRYEMRPLEERLSENFQIVAADWPGFGDQPRPPAMSTRGFPPYPAMDDGRLGDLFGSNWEHQALA
jgi:hypothetical protein